MTFARSTQRLLKRLRADTSGLALVEFAVSLPFFLSLTIGGVEVANYAAVTMQVNQIALHAADNAARMGGNSPLAAKQITEINVNDVFIGAKHEGRGVTLDGFHPYTDPATNKIIARGNARLFMSSLEPIANPNPTNKYKIAWQRCSGPGTHFTSGYGTVANSTNIAGMGPAGRQTIAPDDGAVMFVEVKYHYRPMLLSSFSSMVESDISAIASMVVRENRDFTQIYNPEAAAASTCT
jgi:TadE-like protein